jgi:hypothetical protein
MYVPFAPVVIAALAAAIVAADRRLKSAAQPLRLQLAEKGEKFLQLPNVSKEARNHVRFLLDRAFSMRTPLMVALFAIPIIAIAFVVHPRPFLRSATTMNQMEPNTRSAFFEICGLHDRITLTNHWLLLPLVELEIVLFMPLAIVLRAIIWGRVPETGGRESVLSYIEKQQADFKLRHTHAAANNR